MPRPSSVIDLNVTPGSCGRPSVEMQRKQARPPSTATMSSPRILFDEMPTPTPTVEDPFYGQFMENVIFAGCGEAFQTGGQGGTFDLEETESQDGRGEYMAGEDFEADHCDSLHEEDDIYCEGHEEEEDGIDIAGEPLFMDELTQRAEAQMRKKSIRTGSYTQDEDKLICESWKEIVQDPRVGFKARHNDKPFILTHCWQIINNCTKFKDQYSELQRKRGKKATALAGGGDGGALKRPRGKTNSKVDDKRDAASYALHETLHGMMSQKEVMNEKKRQGKEEQMKQYMKLQTNKLEMEETDKKRKIDMEKAARQRQLDIEAANAATKAKEVALAIMSVDLSKMSEKTRSWFEAQQKEMFDTDGLN
ncbi:Serine/threonine-protein kinase mph1 [Hordeum vulgare]|nr:Serine/threonine-protein kinase mph1 [Hordeum vulgare]